MFSNSDSPVTLVLQTIISVLNNLTNVLHPSNVEAFAIACLNINIRLTKIIISSNSDVDLLAYFMLKQEMVIE